MAVMAEEKPDDLDYEGPAPEKYQWQDGDINWVHQATPEESARIAAEEAGAVRRTRTDVVRAKVRDRLKRMKKAKND